MASQSSASAARSGGSDDVTVVIACFNYGELLTEAVDSALTQAGGPPRVIVVDDGSTDAHTRQVLDALPVAVQVVRRDNGGVAIARNAGLELVQTPYVIVLDADDRLADGALAAMRAPLAVEPALGFSFGTMRFFGAWEGVLRMPDYDPYALLYRHMIGVTALMRRELVTGGVRFDSGLSGYEDWDFWLAALRGGWEGRRVDAETVLYRRHGSTRHFQARYAYHATYRRLQAKYPELYGRAGRRALAARSRLGWGQRQLYRFWWGARPLPARLEIGLQEVLWRVLSRVRLRSAGRDGQPRA
jgi:glycosyltransferase involved in cell wall biosynthesis